MRKWLLDALYEVIENGVYSNLYLRNHLYEIKEEIDRALATRIFYGTLQNHSFCRENWKRYVKKNPSKKTRIILDFSVYQLLFLDKVPAYAVVDEAVRLVKKVSYKEAGLTNAILHKINKETILVKEDETEELAYRTSLPVWLIQMWKAQYGWQQAQQFAWASVQTSPMYVRLNTMRSQALDTTVFEPTQWASIYIYHGDAIDQHPLYLDGTISVQEPGSYEIARFVDAESGMKVLDTCAAPGTKTFAMAELCDDKATIDALDIHAHRIQLIENDKKRLGIEHVHPLCMDATQLSELGEYDLILCDVPCSGYGVLARKPDIKLHMDSSDMDALIPIQYDILCEASKHLKEEGLLIYSTCTLNKKENEKQVERFIEEHPDFHLVESKTVVPDEKNGGFFMTKMKYQKSVI